MLITIDNIKATLTVGGSDNLLPVNLFKEIDNYLKVRPKGYEHVSSYRKHWWDGYKHFMTPKGVFATGFVPLVVRVARDLGATVEIKDNRANIPTFKSEISYHANGKELRDYQGRFLDKLISNTIDLGHKQIPFQRGIYDAATNAGKSLVIVSTLKNIEEPKAIILVHRVELLKQLTATLSEEFGKVGIIYQSKYDIQPITIAMYKTLYARLDLVSVMKDMATFNTLIVDECHNASGDEYSKTIQSINAGLRVFVSGTPLDHDCKAMAMKVVGLSGPTIDKISKAELYDKKVSLRPTVHISLIKTGERLQYTDWTRCESELIHFNKERVDVIRDILIKHKDEKVLINFVEINHGNFMNMRLLETLPDEMLPYLALVHGTSTDRQDIISNFTCGKIKYLLSSSIFQEGIDIPDINVLVYAQGGLSKIALKQYSGRAERNDGVSETITIYDFYDTGKYVENHSRTRIRNWVAEGIEVKYNYNNRNGKPTNS